MHIHVQRDRRLLRVHVLLVQQTEPSVGELRVRIATMKQRHVQSFATDASIPYTLALGPWRRDEAATNKLRHCGSFVLGPSAPHRWITPPPPPSPPQHSVSSEPTSTGGSGNDQLLIDSASYGGMKAMTHCLINRRRQLVSEDATCMCHIHAAYGASKIDHQKHNIQTASPLGNQNK